MKAGVGRAAVVKQEEKRATLAAVGGVKGQAQGIKDEGSRNRGVKEEDSVKNVRKESQKALEKQRLGSEFKWCHVVSASACF